MSSIIRRMDRATIIKWLICIVLTVICLVIPEQSFYNYKVKCFLAVTVFALALSAMELVPNLVVAIIMPALWVFVGVAPIELVMSSWTNSTIIMLVGAYFMAASLENCGLMKRLAFMLMCKVKGSYFGLLLSVLLVSILINILTFGSAYVLMPGLVLGLCLSLNGMKKNIGAGLSAALMLGCATSHAYTYQAPAWGVITSMGSDWLSSSSVTPVTIILHNWPLFVISLLLLWIAYKMYKPEEPIGDVSYFEDHLKAMGKMSVDEKWNAIILCLLLLYTCTVTWTGLDLNLGFALVPFLLYLPFVQGATEKTIDKTNLQILFFVASCMAIGTVATDLGLGDELSKLCLTFLGDNDNPIIILAVVFGIVFLLNFLMTPMAIWSLLTIPLLTIVTQLGYPALPFAYAINACAEAIILPYEYVPYLIIFSFGMMKVKDFFVFNLIRSIVVMAGICVVMTGYWHLIGLM